MPSAAVEGRGRGRGGFDADAGRSADARVDVADGVDMAADERELAGVGQMGAETHGASPACRVSPL